MFKLIFPSKTLEYMCLLSVTIILQSQTGRENKRTRKKQGELCDGLSSRHTLFCEVLNILPPLYFYVPNL